MKNLRTAVLALSTEDQQLYAMGETFRPQDDDD